MSILGMEKDSYTAFFLGYLLSFFSLKTSLVSMFSHLGISGSVVVAMMDGFFYVLMLIIFFSNEVRFKGIIAYLLFFLITAGAITVIIQPSTAVYILGPYNLPFVQQYTPRFFLYSFSGIMIISYLEDTEVFFRILEKFAFVTVIAASICYYLSLDNPEPLEYMTFSYNMLLQTTFLLIRGMSKINVKCLVVGSIGLFIIFVAGCRGALLVCLLSLLIYALSLKTKNIVRKTAVILVFASIIFIFVMYFEQFLEGIIKFLEANNLESRTVKLIMDGEFLEDSGRAKIQEQITGNFNLFGHGMYTDRLLTGSYAHNIFYELLYHYGYIIGGGLFVALCSLIFVAFYKSNTQDRAIMSALLSAGFFKFFLSSSYLLPEPALYVLIGLSALIVKGKHVEKGDK